jgi:hypothetical protein
MAGSQDMDPRLHAYLDGELSASEAAQFKGDLRPGSVSRNQLETLMHLGAWFRTTRPRAPATLADAVVRTLEVPDERALKVYPELGNIGAAGVPITLAKALEQGRVQDGDLVALMGIGSGLNVAMLGVRW